MRLKRYLLDIQGKDLKSVHEQQDHHHHHQHSRHDRDVVELDSGVYKVEPLCFGGFLAIEADKVHCYRRNIQEKLLTKELRKSMRIKCFT